MSATLTAIDRTALFDAGAAHPYEGALRDPLRTLHLHEYRGEQMDGVSPAVSPAPVMMDVDRFRSPADIVDDALVRGLDGPLLDIGCGPGRMVKAAIMAGQLALGIDISRTAVRIAQNQGLPVLCRSVFQDLPGEGTWGTALLLDGNIGIGGDPHVLLGRSAALIRPSGRVLVETHPDAGRDRVFNGVLIDDLNRESLPFPWAETGALALRGYAYAVGLTVSREWVHAGRTFVSLRRS